MVKKKVRVFLGVRDVAGFAGRLYLGLQNKGVDVLFGLLFYSKYEYRNINLGFLSSCIVKMQKKMKSTSVLSKSFHFFRFLAKTVLFIKSLLITQEYIFIGTESFFGLKELPILKMCGKKITFIFLGSESRPWYLNGSVVSSHGAINATQCRIRVCAQKRKISIIERYADMIICHPPTAQFLSKPFLPFLRIGLPAPHISKSNKTLIKNDKDVVIIHAPSNPECKGTNIIRTAISNLKANYDTVIYTELIGFKNKDVLMALETCDFVVDEIYSDTALATLGVEAACLGKPTIVGSYSIPQRDFGVPVDLIPPSVFVHPEDVEKAILKLFKSKEERDRIGKATEEFIKTNWSPESVAGKLLEYLQYGVPENELSDPAQIKYFHGWGFSEKREKEYLSEYVEQNGVKALMLSDKPNLERAVLDFIDSKKLARG